MAKFKAGDVVVYIGNVAGKPFTKTLIGKIYTIVGESHYDGGLMYNIVGHDNKVYEHNLIIHKNTYIKQYTKHLLP